MNEQRFEKAAQKKVLLVGERIKDVYHYGRLIGRPPKEPIICMEWRESQEFQGGVTAAAEHAKSFVKEVSIVSDREVEKVRFVEESHYRKLFELYASNKENYVKWPDVSEFDAVIVTDYGHGMMTKKVIDRLSKARFLAVNVQTNSGNYGFNLATKYPHVHYLCVDEIEARLATLNPDGYIEESVESLGAIAEKVVITLGRNGAIGTGNTRAEAFTNRVVDTMGAGDAFFVVTACIAEEIPMEELLRIGNAAGAMKTQSLGQRAVKKDELLSFLNR